MAFGTYSYIQGTISMIAVDITKGHYYGTLENLNTWGYFLGLDLNIRRNIIGELYTLRRGLWSCWAKAGKCWLDLIYLGLFVFISLRWKSGRLAYGSPCWNFNSFLFCEIEEPFLWIINMASVVISTFLMRHYYHIHNEQLKVRDTSMKHSTIPVCLPLC